MKKVYKSAICVVVPEFDQIQTIRKQYDPAYPRWPPHINLIYPFYELEHFEKFYSKIQSTLTVDPFTITFNSFGIFKQRKVSVLYLEPDPESTKKLQQIYKTLLIAIGEDPEKARELHPHLTVGKFKKNQIQKFKKQFEMDWKPIQTTVAGLQMINRKDDTPFEITLTIDF